MRAHRRDGAGPRRLAHLLEPGHRHIARITGPSAPHTRTRTQALLDGCRAVGLDPVPVEDDYSAASGARPTRHLLHGDTPPTTILYDNDAMAVTGLAAAEEP